MTALVLIFTGTYDNPAGLEGAQLTSQAFSTIISWFPYLLVVAIFLFAFSTMISWSYYGLKGFDYLFGDLSEKFFKTRNVAKYTYFTLFLLFIVIGASSNLGSVMDFSDMMILSMAFPNILGLLILAPEIKRDLNDYQRKLRNGEIKKFK
jgi:AGCS family alanine or glycine:cation symporter